MERHPEGFRPAIAAIVAALRVTAWVQRAPPPPAQQDLCAIFARHPHWYDQARDAEARWSIPATTLMAFIQLESGFRRGARPPREYLFDIIPWKRISSAYGYGQIQDPVWGEYLNDRPAIGRSRRHIDDVLDFIGWYNRATVERIGIEPANVKHLYLAYHQGRTGYRRGDWRRKPAIENYAERVAARASDYRRQLRTCRARFDCDGLLEFGPWCSGSNPQNPDTSASKRGTPRRARWGARGHSRAR